MRSPTCAPAAASVTLNCGYGHGFSVLEVIETVKRVVGRRLPGRVRGPARGRSRPIVAASDRARAVLGWQPRFDDLATIVTHALAWEQRLSTRGG